MTFDIPAFAAAGVEYVVPTSYKTRTSGRRIYLDPVLNVYLNPHPTGRCVPADNDSKDIHRRLSYVTNARRVLDFGCGTNSFARAAESLAKVEVVGVDKGDDLPEGDFEIVTMFHVLEHLLDPIDILRALRQQYDNSLFVIEVPSAQDILLRYGSEAYMARAFHDDHVILHSDVSLWQTLIHAGFSDIEIIYVHRYGLDNHRKWCHWIEETDAMRYRRGVSECPDTLLAIVS